MQATQFHKGRTLRRGAIPLWQVRAIVSLSVAVVVLALPIPGPWQNRVVVAYAAWITVLCTLTYAMISRPRREEMAKYVRREVSASWVPLLVAAVLALVSLATIVYMMHTATHHTSGSKMTHMAVSLYSVLITWVSLHTVFAMHYAVLYYSPSPDQPDEPVRGLSFPGADLAPDYWDFLYYAFVIGMCYQTSDVSVERPDIRRYTLLHSVFSYLYGVGILSLLVSLVGGAF
jgi:uncharacterized membrane protein